MSQLIGAASNYEEVIFDVRIPSLTDTANIVEAFKAYHFGLDNFQGDVEPAANSIHSWLKDFDERIETVEASTTITLTGTSISGIPDEPSVVTSTTIGPGSMTMFQGSVFGSAEVSFYQYIYNNQLNYYATGLSEITWRNYYTNPASPTYNYSSSRVSTVNDDQFRPIGVTPFGGQYMGQRLFSGTATSNSTINSDINNRSIANQSLNGDFYFSTA